MKYGAPEEIRTPDPQIRSLTNGSGFPPVINDLPKRVCFGFGLKPHIDPHSDGGRKHNPLPSEGSSGPQFRASARLYPAFVHRSAPVAARVFRAAQETMTKGDMR